MFWRKKEKETLIVMSSATPDRIIISDQPVDREWRDVVGQLDGMLSQAHAAMQNAQLAQMGRLSEFSQQPVTSGERAKQRMRIARVALMDIGDAVPDPDEIESNYMPVNDGIGTDLEPVRIVRTEMGTGKVVHVRFVGDVDSRIALFHQEHVTSVNEGRAVYWTNDPNSLKQELGFRGWRNDGRTEILRTPLMDYHDIADCVENLRRR